MHPLLLSVALAQATPGGRHEPPAARSVRVAAIQAPSRVGETSHNVALLERLIREAAANGAKIVVLPEAAIPGYLSQDLSQSWVRPGWPLDVAFEGRPVADVAEPIPGPTTERFAALADALDIYLTVPLIESDGGEPTPRYYNAVALVTPDGAIATRYRKRALWHWPEQAWASPGRGGASVETPWGRVGLALGDDIDLAIADYADDDLWALLCSIAWVDDAHPADWFWHGLPGRVAASDHHMIGANWSVEGPEDWFGYGFSTIVSSNGDVLATATSLYGEQIVYADLEVDETPGSIDPHGSPAALR